MVVPKPTRCKAATGAPIATTAARALAGPSSYVSDASSNAPSATATFDIYSAAVGSKAGWSHDFLVFIATLAVLST